MPEATKMSTPKIVSRDVWLAARKALLIKEKANASEFFGVRS